MRAGGRGDGLVRLLAVQPWDADLVPVAVAAMILAVAYNPHFALMVTFGLCLLTSLALGTGIGHFLVVMGGTAAGVLTLNEVRTRTKLIKVGATAALGYFVLTWATGLWQNQPPGLIASDSLWRAGWGLMAGFFLGGSLPFVENSFGIVTGISLLELGDITHPLLQELVRRAPGTHNHSITVATIAEGAAERIGRTRSWSGSAPTSTTSARCSSRTTSSRTWPAPPTATPTWRRR